MIPRNLQITILLLILSIVLAGGYILHLKSEAEKIKISADSASHTIATPLSGPKEPIQLVIAYDEDGVVRVKDSSANLPLEPAARSQEILRVLFKEYLQKPSPHMLGEGSDVRSVYMLANGTCIIDLNADFATHHPSGALVEQLSLISMAQTLMLNSPYVKKVKFLVDGNSPETLAGHIDLSPTFTSEQVAQMMQELKY
jgi:hypothetical protein